MSSVKISGLFLFVSLLGLVSCGGSGGGSGSSASNPVRQKEEDKIKHYQAVLKPLNPETTSQTAGVVMIRVDGDEFEVQQTVTEAPGGVRHFQAIMSGKSCAAIDENADGYIDLAEGSKVFGKRLVPLDSNLDSQLEGIDFGPIANEANAYIYNRHTSVSKLLSDLTALDPDEQDDLMKLNSDKDLTLSKRIVVIMGTNRDLPETVSGNGTYSAAEGLPIACGELAPMKNEDVVIE